MREGRHDGSADPSAVEIIFICTKIRRRSLVHWHLSEKSELEESMRKFFIVVTALIYLPANI